MSCSHNLKPLALACHNYHDTYNLFPAGNYTPGNCCGTLSGSNWAIDTLPFIEQENLFKRYVQVIPPAAPNVNTANNSPPNAFVRSQHVKTHQCPSDPNVGKLGQPASGPAPVTADYAFGSYRAVSGFSGITGRVFWDTCEPDLIAQLPAPLNTALPQQWKGVMHSIGATHSRCPQGGPEKMTSIIDGTSNTALIGEYYNLDVPRRSTFWAYSYTSYNQSSIQDQSRTINNRYGVAGSPLGCCPNGSCANLPGQDHACKRGFGSTHTGGLNFAFADGSVRFVSNNVDMRILGTAATIAGGEVANLP
jgi:prepilin-type processing-associated H-X9-DG protein